MKKPAVYVRADGTCGIRNHLFALPTVVCANQVAIHAARDFPGLKYIEHQHGCAQIGADNEQTRTIFARLAQHPNVYAGMLVSLGCEGIVTEEVLLRANAIGHNPIAVTVIQESGGTLGAGQSLAEWLKDRDKERDRMERSPVEWSDLRIGIMVDDSDDVPDIASIVLLLTALREWGAQVIVPNALGEKLRESGLHQIALAGYGEVTGAPVSAMATGSNDLETCTGMTAAGAHLIVHVASQPHMFASPLAPTLRFAMNEEVRRVALDDFDGVYSGQADLDGTLDLVARVVSGEETVAEQLGMEQFGLYRIGPTV